MRGLPKRKCPVCSQDAEYTVVPQYVWDREEGVSVEISEARLVVCYICGEFPSDQVEASRWNRIARQWEIDSDPTLSGTLCSNCGIPKEQAAQFYEIGWSPEDMQYFCGECYDGEKISTTSLNDLSPGSPAI